jgi:HPt (histidine-containing phosphotransfer) domain-containing protein/CheY-like chemotaxis protein
MKTLRVLVVNSDSADAARLTELLAGAHHLALPTNGLAEAEEALFVQKFDAVLLGPQLPRDSVAEFTARLRTLESRQRSVTPAPVLSLSPELPNGAEWCECETGVDGYLLDPFQPATLCQAVTNLAESISRSTKLDGRRSGLPILDLEEFRAQVSQDNDLMRDIIDLFLTESPGQMTEMCEALSAGDLDRLSRVAHTIKGSFAALHAEQARCHAQDLETAAKSSDAAECAGRLCVLEQDLELLKPRLISAREAATGD